MKNMAKVYKVEEGNLVITIPLKTKRWNPYEDEPIGEMDNIIGVYHSEYDNGLCYRIDMDYKGKDDQWTDFFYKSDVSLEEFQEMCKELKIDMVYDNAEL